MTHIAPLVTVILTASLLRWTAAQASILCSWTKVLPDGEVHYSFLRQDSPSARLYHSAWSGERALLGCSWSEDASVIQNYLSLCLERAQEFSDHPDENFHLDSLFDEGGQQCVSAAELGYHSGKRPVRSAGGLLTAQNSQGQDERSEVRSHVRVKRGFIVPGTLWCGSGNKAPSYADLGVFADTDSCCREHDQCKHTILSFHSEFGVFNTNIFTMSHCDCDNKFRTCLREANDSISDVVGYTFFNLLKMHCFEFSHRLQCTQRNWFGMCKETKMALYAEVHPPTLYESVNPTQSSMNSTISIINTTIPAELPESSTSDPQLISITAAASTCPYTFTSSPSASITAVTDVTTSTVTNTSERPAASVPEGGDDLENTLPTRNQTVTEQDADITEMQLSCGVYKDLDKCRNKILPQQRRFGLHNPEPRTLYHCNCTSRLFQTLAQQRQLTEVQALLLGHVSQSCFLPQDCTAGKICAAVLVRADLPQLDWRSGAEVEEQRHLQAVKLKVRRPNTRRAKRKDRAVRLHKLCLRMTRPRRTNKTRTHGPNTPRPVTETQSV
ncbi:LOW QUALITY PROTEIN: group 3 secretory phospholipase A2 [Lates calcarifer]|uniref:phospholipase A2 n=1 Tax=Lates calcarifer TaxID=8187 RepID=A0AAJ7VGK9_LATCA|nr:LOW QUALITY PROTEIN: group 3 secretory phospholipase A2 [Lates calcarifer]